MQCGRAPGCDARVKPCWSSLRLLQHTWRTETTLRDVLRVHRMQRYTELNGKFLRVESQQLICTTEHISKWTWHSVANNYNNFHCYTIFTRWYVNFTRKHQLSGGVNRFRKEMYASNVRNAPVCACRLCACVRVRAWVRTYHCIRFVAYVNLF